MNTTLLDQYKTTASDGYMGATRYDGNKSSGYMSDADLSRNIKKSLQDVLAPELKKSDVKVRKDSYSIGCHVYVTLKLDKNTYAPTRDEYKAAVVEKVKRDGYLWILDDDGIVTFHEAYYKMAPEQQKAAEDKTAEQHAAQEYDAASFNLNHYHIDSEALLNESGRAIVRAANQVICAYNYDDSNSMVDYFNTNFYYTIEIEWK